MARTPSKITKRDIDKDLYLEIVNEASNETNIQKLLDDYVRKDEGIAEWQLPTQYRQNLTKRINDIDADVQNMKSDKTQQQWNEDVAKRLAAVEKKEGIVVDDDSNVSPIIGTQVAANTSSITKNKKQLDVLKGQQDEFSGKFEEHKIQNDNAHEKIKIEFDEKLESQNTRLKRLDNSLNQKRDKAVPITEEDLDEKIRTNMHAVLNIGESTLSALDNMDAFVTRVDTVEKQAEAAKTSAEDALIKASAAVSNIDQTINERTSVINDTVQKNTDTLHASIEQYHSDAVTATTGLQEQVNSLRDTQTSHMMKIDQVNDKVENVARGMESNTINIANNTDNLEELKNNVRFRDEQVTEELKYVNTRLDNNKRFPDVSIGQFMTTLDGLGDVVGKDLVASYYVANDELQLKQMMENSYTPIYYKSSDYLIRLKTSDDIKTEAPTEEPKKDEPETQPSESGDKTESGTADTSAPSTEGTETKTDASSDAPKASSDAPSETPTADSGSSTEPSDSGSTTTDDELTEEEKKTDEEIMKELGVDKYMDKYIIIHDCMKKPSNHNVLIYDIYSATIAAYTDRDGNYREFLCVPSGEKIHEVTIDAHHSVDILRDRTGSGRVCATALIFDNDATSQTCNKWINSEGVITVAYSDDAYTLYNNSDIEQKVRLYTD